MANTKEIKDRIKSVRDTQKITNAMYLIASTKMRKAKSELDHTRPYFEAIKGEIKRIFRTSKKEAESRWFYPEDGAHTLTGPYACLVITADKGLAGMYNQNVIREAEKMLKEHPDTRLFVVGEYGRQYFAHHGIPVERSFLYTAQNPTMQRAREISSTLLELFERDEVCKIFVVYTDIRNGMFEEAKTDRLLPFHRKIFADNTTEKAITRPFEFTPSIEAVLATLVPSYVSGYIYSALVDSFCAEQNARMTAMNSANQNAEKLLGELSVQYNRSRQAAITQEITEISSGAKAQKRKLAKKKNEEACGH
jgi:F-type H+-transporting ATPase subunit gamma